MKIEGLKNLLKKTPVILQSDPITLAYLENVEVVENLQSFIKKLDMPIQMASDDIVIIDKSIFDFSRFPAVQITEDLFKPELNELLFAKYEFLSKYLFTQKDVGKLIASDVDTDVIILYLVDGLSYINCRDIREVEPCFVNGATLTDVGFRNIVGDPPIAYKLFENGFKSRIGFSYWERDNGLTNILFEGFVDEQMHRVSEYDSIIQILKEESLEKTFVQIVVAGCDGVAHKNRDRPPVRQLVKRIFEEYIQKMEDIIRDKGLHGIMYLVADHGIWWKPNGNEEEYIVISDSRAKSKRFLDGHIIRNDVLHVESYGKKYSLLKHPYLFSDYAINEWGTHGGISYYESFVPFYKREVI